jgi:hypothetical protein
MYFSGGIHADRMIVPKDNECPLKKGMIVLFALIILLGCTPGRNESPKAIQEKFEIGETVYVCGCPMMCCNSISKNPNGRCACNFPLRQGTVARIQNGKLYVNVSGRQKTFFITSR